jgi:hypothetical protein
MTTKMKTYRITYHLKGKAWDFKTKKVRATTAEAARNKAENAKIIIVKVKIVSNYK